MRFAFACAILGVWQLTLLATNVSGQAFIKGECPVKRAAAACEHDIEPVDQRRPFKDQPADFTPDSDSVRFYPARPGNYTLRYRAENLCGVSVRDVNVEVKCPPAPTVSVTSNLIANALQNSQVEFVAAAVNATGGNPSCQFQYKWTLYRLNTNAAFSSAKHKDKDAVVKGGQVVVDDKTRSVKWTGSFSDGTKKITSVDDQIGGRVILSDGTAFENPYDDRNARIVPPLDTREEMFGAPRALGQKYKTVPLKEPGNYEAEVTVDDGCAKKTLQYCFQVVCNCGPTANAKATQTIWTNSKPNGKRDNRENGVKFTLDGSLSSDFDLAYSADEKLTYDWSITEWIPQRDMPRPILTSQVSGSTNAWDITPNGKWSLDPACTDQTMADKAYQVSCALTAATLTKTYLFKHVPLPNAPNRQVCYTENSTSCKGVETPEFKSPAAAQPAIKEEKKDPFGWILPDGSVKGTGATFEHNSLSTAQPPTTVPFETSTNRGAEMENFMIDNWAAGASFKPQLALEQKEQPWLGANIDPSTTSCMGYLDYTQRVETLQQLHYRVETSTINTGQETKFCRMTISQKTKNDPKAELEVANPKSDKNLVTKYYGAHGAFEVCRGLWKFRLTVQDLCVTNVATDEIVVTVRCNRPPVAIAGCTEAVAFSTKTGTFPQVTVDGRFSRDDDNPDMDGLTYFWSFESVPSGVDYSAECEKPDPCEEEFCQKVRTDTVDRYHTCVHFASTTKSSKLFGHAVKQNSACPNTRVAEDEVSQRTVQYAGLRLEEKKANCGLKVYPVVYDCQANLGQRLAANPPGPQPECSPIDNSEYHRGNSAYFTPKLPGEYKVKLQIFDGCSLSQDMVTVTAVCPELQAKIQMTKNPNPTNDAPVDDLTLQYSVTPRTSVRLHADVEYGDVWEKRPHSNTPVANVADFFYEMEYYTTADGCPAGSTAQACCQNAKVAKKEVNANRVARNSQRGGPQDWIWQIPAGDTTYTFCLKITDRQKVKDITGKDFTRTCNRQKVFASGSLTVNCNSNPVVQMTTVPSTLTQAALTAVAAGTFPTVTLRVSPASNAAATCSANTRDTLASDCDKDNDALSWTWSLTFCKKDTCVDADYRPFSLDPTAAAVKQASAPNPTNLVLNAMQLRGQEANFYENGNGQLRFRATAAVTDGCSTVSLPRDMVYRCTPQVTPTTRVIDGTGATPNSAAYSYANQKFDTLKIETTSQAPVYLSRLYDFKVTKSGGTAATPNTCTDPQKSSCSYVPTSEGTYSVTLTISDSCTRRTSAPRTFTALCTDAQKPRFSGSDFVVRTRSQDTPPVIAPVAGSTLLWDSRKFMPKGDKYRGGFPDLQLQGCPDAAKCKSVQGGASDLWYFFYTTKPATPPAASTETALAGDNNSGQRAYVIDTAGTWSFRLQILNGPNPTRGCLSGSMAQTITATCLTINPTMSLTSASDRAGTTSISSSWTGLAFQEIHMRGAADGARLYNNGNVANPANLDALVYKWTVKDSPKESRWVVSETKSETSKPEYEDVAVRPKEVKGTNQSVATQYRVTTKTTSTVTVTTLFNHHHNMPITGFRPDVVGSYTIELEVRDGCTKKTASAVIRAQCPTGGAILRGGAIAAKAFLPEELHENSALCANCNPRAQAFGTAGTRSSGGASPTITIAGNSFRRVTADARDILVVPTGGGPACSTLTYSWSMYGPKQDDPTFGTGAKPVELTDTLLTNSRGNLVSFVPRRSGNYDIKFRVCRDTPRHSASSTPMKTIPSAAMCQACEERSIVIQVVCDTSDLPKKAPASSVVNQDNREAIHYIPRKDVCNKLKAAKDAAAARLVLGTGVQRFKDPNFGENAYFELKGDPKPAYPQNCKVLKRQWILYDRQCAKSFTKTVPVVPGKTQAKCAGFSCTWRVKKFPCGWETTAYAANSWVENCNGENCELNPLKAGTTNAERNYATCIAPFRCRRPGTYTLELKVDDACSVKTTETVVVCRCASEVIIDGMKDVDVMKTCDDTNPKSTERVFKELRLTAEIKTKTGRDVRAGLTDYYTECPKPAPAPAAPAGTCCPAVVPCQACATCATCTACPGGSNLPGQGAQSGANPDQHDTPVVPGAILGAMPLSTAGNGNTIVDSQPVAPVAENLDTYAVPGALLGMGAVPGAVVPGSNGGVPGMSATASRNGDDFPYAEEILQKRSSLMSEDEQETDVSSSMLLGVVIPISSIIVGSLIGNVLMLKKLRRVNNGLKSKSLA